MHFHLLAVIVAAAGISARFLPQFPSSTPAPTLPEKRQLLTSQAPTSTLSPDPWQCVTENITQYFDVPKPTGSLLDNLNSYGEEVVKPCKATATGFDYFSCTVSDPKSWCGFETAVPSNVISDYSSYVTAAVSFWTEKSNKISVLSTSCAVTWAKHGPAKLEWLKIATAHAQCYLDARPTTATPASKSTTLTASDTSSESVANPIDSTVTTTSTATIISTETTTSTTTTTGNAASLGGRAVEAFTLMSSGLAILSNVI